MNRAEREAARERIERVKGDNAMHSACGEYNCDCHADLPHALDFIDELLDALKDVMNGQLCGNVDLDAPRFRAARAVIAKDEGGQ